MPITLTQLLAEDRHLQLYGHQVTDLSPRGDLGLGLDPDGPVGFAQVRAYRCGGHVVTLDQPLLLSVFGPGVEAAPEDMAAHPGERMWRVRQDDPALSLHLQQAPVLTLLRRRATRT